MDPKFIVFRKKPNNTVLMPEGRRQGPNHHQGDQAREEAQNADPRSLDSPALTRRRDTPLSAARESAQVSRDIFFLVF